VFPRPTGDFARLESQLTDRLIRFATALAVVAVACIAAIISYQHAHEFLSTPWHLFLIGVGCCATMLFGTVAGGAGK
jgi:hypothetical protein